ncbi:MAG TPA: endonuclease, partial [Saprospiraceae bacterium]|nr:endonuclease [Saprospiraceae bacterium]
LDSLFAHYRPDTVLPYALARDTLYGKVLAIDDDSVRCIYSGHTLYLDPTQDPTQYIYLGGSSLGMNAEHAYPQSKGAADGNARSDMHHLYPARIPVNEARASLPYGEIPDAQTQKWFWKTQVLTSIPAQHIERYSEATAARFEPREAVKGDLARSVFYFYTMYRSQANAADPNFFESQRPTLCQWNAQDPADSTEMIKTWRIAHYQDGKPNPYVLDCTLAQRSWCPDTPPNCSVGTRQPAAPHPLRARVLPQPAGSTARLELLLPFSGDVRGTLRTVLGQEWASFRADGAASGAFSLPLDLSSVSSKGPWVGFLEVELRSSTGVLRQVLTVVGE